MDRSGSSFPEKEGTEPPAGLNAHYNNSCSRPAACHNFSQGCAALWPFQIMTE